MTGRPDPERASGASPEQEAKRVLFRLESILPPRDFVDRIALEEAQGNSVLAQVMRDSDTGRDLRGQAMLQAFGCHEICHDARLYRGAPSPEGRRLLVAMTGQKRRLMMPITLFLQCIDAAEWDVLVLEDAALTHFRDGVAGFADSFLGIVARVHEMARPYRAACAIGTSMGGLPAIRLALLCGGMRGISVGGRPPFDVIRLFDKGTLPAAYDPLCACLPPQTRDMILAHAAGNEIDRQAATTFAALVGGLRLGVEGTSNHSLFASLSRDGRLAPFLATVLRDDILLDLVPQVFDRESAPWLRSRRRKPLWRRLLRRVWPGRRG